MSIFGSMKRHIPNLITLGNLLCGSLAVVAAVHGDLEKSGILILLGAFLDFFDGLAARLLKVSNDMGKELDSLADMVSFGLAPTLIAFEIMHRALFFSTMEMDSLMRYIPYIIVLLSAMRLAKFNIDDRQTIDFIGMPTPANALLWLSIGLSLVWFPNGWIRDLFLQPYVVAITAVLSAIMLVIELPMFSLKIKKLSIKGNEWKLTLLIISVILLLIMSVQAMPLIIIIYLILSVIKYQTSKSKDNRVTG